MLDALTKVVSQADTRGAYISDAEIDALKDMVAAGSNRMDVVNRITGNASTIVANAARALFEEQPQLIAPGGNAYTNRLFAGDASVLDDRCLNGLRETYQALGVPGASVSTGVQKMKEA
ncbi:unnamed protein product, partial [Fusarium equiseti]